MDLPDLQRLVEMIRHCKKATMTLQTIAKSSFTTGQLRCRKFSPYRSLLMKMFLEIFVADGDILAAETIVQNQLLDSAYTQNALLISYNVILIMMRTISCVTEKYGDDENNLFESDDFLHSLRKIIKDPFNFYDITVDLLKKSNDMGSERTAAQRLGECVIVKTFLLNYSLYFQDMILF